MARIAYDGSAYGGSAYDERAAAAFRATRHLPDHGLRHWRAAVARHLRPGPGARLLDLGAGTGAWAQAFTDWYGVHVIAVEPAAAMRARCPYPIVVGGDAAAVPLRPACVDGAWLSTVIHHLPDLTAAASELRRVVRPGGAVLIRSAFPGRHHDISLFRYFPEAVRVLDAYPTVARVAAAFAGAGFTLIADEQVPQVTADSLAEAAAGLRREAHTPLKLITGQEYAAGLARLRRAAAHQPTGPVVDALSLLVLR